MRNAHSRQLHPDLQDRNGSKLSSISSFLFSPFKRRDDTPSYSSAGLGSRVGGGTMTVDKGDYFLNEAMRRQLRVNESNLNKRSVRPSQTGLSTGRKDSSLSSTKKASVAYNEVKVMSQRDRVKESMLQQSQSQFQHAPSSARSNSSTGTAPSTSQSTGGRSSAKQSKTVLVKAKSKQSSNVTNQSSPASILAALNNIRTATAAPSAPIAQNYLKTPSITPPSSIPSSGDAENSEDCKGDSEKETGALKDEKKLCCDKCDGKHETDKCPYYKKKRENHPDAQRSKKHMGGLSRLPGSVLRNARVVRQPGDGSCLFHSMSYGLPGSSKASKLRSEICSFIASNPNFKISDTPLKDWVKWDSGSSVAEYSRTMSRGSWGGGIEMACCSQIKGVNVHVYERYGTQFKRISAFDHPNNPESKPIVRVLYCGGVHYDALVAS